MLGLERALDIGEDLKRGVRNIKDIVTFDEDELTDEVLNNRIKATLKRTEEMEKHLKKAEQFEEKIGEISAAERKEE